ncbi:VWA domain-containing protein [Salinisphaera sp. T31B1]|uniref:vWA domain-containing protein n=1 Tax=Salinisphaera sp. T31B1 TaxID=727963 RepID=UPI00333F4F1D
MSGWSLAGPVADFAAALRRHGAAVSPVESADALAALERLMPAPEPTFRSALQATMAKTPEARRIFDTVYPAFWHARVQASVEAEDREASDPGDPPTPTPASADGYTPAPSDADAPGVDSLNGPDHGASALRSARDADLAGLDDNEQQATAALIRALGRALARRADRRWRARGQGRLDMRASLRAALARGGEVAVFRRRWRPPRRPRLVVLADVSRSMSAYSRFALLFIHAFGQVFRSVESFVFSTGLTRATTALAAPSPAVALDRLAATLDDWAGGTRIASAIERYVARYGARQLGRDTVVIVISDGWDTDPPDRLAAALQRLHGQARALIWLDPLMDHPRYFASALGMQHTSPHVDLCVPARNVAGLAALTERLTERRLI